MRDQTHFLEAAAWTIGIGALATIVVGSARTAHGQTPAGEVTIQTSRTTGLASFVTPAGKGPIRVPRSAGRVVPTAMDFVKAYGHLFGITDPDGQLILAKTTTDALGFAHTTYHQIHRGVPVFAGVLRVHQNASREITAANGDFFPISNKLNTTPTIDAATAQKHAAAVLPRVSVSVEQSDLVIVDPGWYGDPPRGEHLAYHIILTNLSAPLREAFFVDAHTGAILDRWSMIDRGRVRSIHDTLAGSTCCYGHGQAGCDDSTCQTWVCGVTDPDLAYCCENEWDDFCAFAAGNFICTDVCALPGPLARGEGDPLYGDEDVDAAYDYFGDTYDYYFRGFGRDSIDDLGMSMIGTVNSQLPFCPNAYWDGSQMVFCPGLVTDDIVGHELTHGVTQFTANLIYQNQPGQLNESFSDVFGELIDLFNGNAAFPGPPGGTPWPKDQWYQDSGLDTPNSRRSTPSSCSYTPSHADGVRWLLGEDASGAGGGAIRDLWDPTCFYHPDRAFSELQTCGGPEWEDNGGVHSGSGIANHAFAIMTDGKTFNGYTVAGIGPIKSAAVWYRALTVYLAAASDFEDAYFALTQAAQDLIGTTPIDPRTGGPSDSMFTADDAAEVERALLAVEMNTEGACGAVTPILNSDPPDKCAPRFTVYSENFESGPSRWTVAHQLEFPGSGAVPYDWALVSDLPFSRAGTAWFCDDPSFGHNCMTATDESAVHSLFSPVITLPKQFDRPTLAVTHYMASEEGWDGGNLKISIDGGSWQLVPESAFDYNPYNSAIIAVDNLNPLGGEAAWTGAGGRWGTSIVDLGGFVTGGEEIQFRFDFGKDMCNGVDGWYVDDFEVYVCSCADNPTTIEDCNINDVPDDCELDCNYNGIADECDISGGTTDDCNENGFPDECEMTGTAIRVAQESSPGAGDFDENILGFIEPFDTSLSAADFYAYGVVVGASFNGSDPPLSFERSHLFLVDAADGLSLFVVHDRPQNATDGSASTRYVLDGDPDGAFRTVEDDPGDGYTGGPGSSVFTADHVWNVCCTDGLALTGLDGAWSMKIEFTSSISGLDSWAAYSPDRPPVVLELVEGRRLQLIGSADCNETGAPDACDIADGTSDDCSGNGIPDECEPDCNVNDAADSCDISGGASKDCNANEIPDECDLDDGTSGDCDANGTPDDCQPDCDDDGIPDVCKLPPLGNSADCNSNGIPDECEPDCDDNGVADSCEIADGISEDCDSNGIPDECEDDSDSDGVIDACDGCADDPDKTRPGQCGCGAADDDSDSDGTADCNDGCPRDSSKTSPGQCGCGNSDADSDDDGVADCHDGCPDDAGKSEPGECGCAIPETDTDSDGTPDCIDECPDDPNETEAGVCGCGVRERDSDLDGTPNCIDGCPNNPRKIEPGVCGCLTPETDSDGDGTPDCRDGCARDQAKTEAGVCGCSVADTDSDADGLADCLDACPGDSTKIEPGACGCGIPDIDADGNGVADCVQDLSGDAAADSMNAQSAVALKVSGPAEIAAGTSGNFIAQLEYGNGGVEEVTDRVRWAVYAGDYTFEDAVQTGVATMSSGGELRCRADVKHDVELRAVAHYLGDAVELIGHQSVTMTAAEPVAPQPAAGTDPSLESTRRFCGVGLMGPVIFGLSLLALTRLTRRTRYN